MTKFNAIRFATIAVAFTAASTSAFAMGDRDAALEVTLMRQMEQSTYTPARPTVTRVAPAAATPATDAYIALSARRASEFSTGFMN